MFQAWLKDEDLHCVLTVEASVQFKCLWYLDNPVGFRCKFVKIFVDRRIVSKYSIKIRSKVNQDWNSFKIMNRTAPWQTQVYEIKCYMSRSASVYKVCTETLACTGNYNKLQYNNLGQFPCQTANLLRNNYIFLNKSLHLKSDSHLPKKMFNLLQWKPFEIDEKCFLFHLKSSIRFQDI